MKIAFFEIKPQDQQTFKEHLSDHELLFFEDKIDLATIPNDIEILSTHISSKIDKQLLDKLPSLKLVATRTTGFDHIDLQAAKEKGVVVCNVPAYGEDTVAEFTFALLLALTRKVYPAIKLVKENYTFNTNNLTGTDLHGKTLGVIGTGRIGQHVISIAKGFGMEVIAFDLYPNQELATKLGFQYLSLDEVYKTADILTFHVPATPQTYHLLNQEKIGLIKKGVLIVNTSRGSVAQTTVLLEALKSGHIQGLALDVLEEEADLLNRQADGPLDPSLQELISHENCLVTPHNAFNSKEALARILETSLTNITSFISQNPQNTVTN